MSHLICERCHLYIALTVKVSIVYGLEIHAIAESGLPAVQLAKARNWPFWKIHANAERTGRVANDRFLLLLEFERRGGPGWYVNVIDPIVEGICRQCVEKI